jgi:hypothetical protein
MGIIFFIYFTQEIICGQIGKWFFLQKRRIYANIAGAAGAPVAGLSGMGRFSFAMPAPLKINYTI